MGYAAVDGGAADATAVTIEGVFRQWTRRGVGEQWGLKFVGDGRFEQHEVSCVEESHAWDNGLVCSGVWNTPRVSCQ